MPIHDQIQWTKKDDVALAIFLSWLERQSLAPTRLVNNDNAKEQISASYRVAQDFIDAHLSDPR